MKIIDNFKTNTIISICIFCYGCPTYDPPFSGSSLLVKNETKQTIYVYLSCNDSLKIEDKHWAFSMPKNETDQYGELKKDTIFPYNRLDPNEEEEIQFEGTINRKKTDNCQDNQWRLFVISDTIMMNHNWNEIAGEQHYISKVILTKQFLDESNWHYSIK